MSTPTLHEYLSKRLEEKRKNHPSFRLMDIDDRLFPNAQTKHSTLVLEARDSKDELKTVAEIVAESWKKGDKNHLMIEGEGGIGKTVTLLSIPDKFTPFSVPAIYIPLHELPQGDDPIERYIKKKVLNNKEDLYGQLLDLLEKPWDKGPQLLLLLDGFNEIAAENRQTISEDIGHWSEYSGIQVVTSSRYDIHTYVALSYDYSTIKLQPLSNTTVEIYLNSMGVRIPAESAVKELITIPLLLTLYVKTEFILEQRETDSAEFKEAKNAGSIVWNYLQCELWHFGKENQDAKNAIIAMEFIAPYMAWQMQQNSMFILDKKDFHKFLGDAYKMLENHFNKPDDFPFQIQDVLQKADGIPPLETIRNLLEKILCLFVKNGNSYRLMHQQFRDALAAMHLINSIYLNGNSRPTEWNSTVDHYVMQFVADLISEDEANRLWEQNRTSLQIESATRNQLELHRRLYECDFSKLNFSRLDLSNISLYPYRVGNAMLKLPTDADAMKELKSSEKTFSPEGHNAWVNTVAITPDNRRVVSGSLDYTIRVWDLEGGQCLKTLQGHNAWVRAVAITPDGRFIVSGSDDKTIRIWDIENGQCLKTLYGHGGSVRAIAITSDGRHIVSGSSDWAIRVWDMESGQCLKKQEGHCGSVRAVAITPDCKNIISGSEDRTIRIWEMESSKCLKILTGHKGEVNTVAITSNCRYIVSGSWDKTIRVWDMKSGECLKSLAGHKGGINAIAITPEGGCIVSGSDDSTIRVWDTDCWQCRNTMEGHDGWVYAVSITSDGRRIVSGSLDHTMRVWDLKSGQYLKLLEGYGGSVRTVAISPVGRRIVSGSNDSIIRVWDLDSRQCLKTLKGCGGSVRAVAISSDDRDIVSGFEDGTICIWDIESGQCQKTLMGHKGGVNSIAISSDGCRIVSGSEDRTIRIWDTSSGQCLKTLEGHGGSVRAVAISHDGKHIVSGSEDRTIRVWELESGQYLITRKSHDVWVTAVAITLGDRYIVSGSEDGIVRVWDMNREQGMKTLEGHKGVVDAVFITKDGRYVASGSWDNTIRVWNLESLECVFTIQYCPLFFWGLDFSKAIISTPELKEQLRQNGAKV